MSQSIWLDLGSPTDLSVAAIQSKLISNPFLGNLNNLIVTCYSGVSGDISPAMGIDEQAIYTNLYIRDYYTTKLNQTLAGFNTSFTTISEGDSRISRSSTADVARLYRDMQKQLNEELGMQISSYRQNQGQPASVLYPTLVQGAYDGGGYGGVPQNYYRS